jgi:hypothetical protein
MKKNLFEVLFLITLFSSNLFAENTSTQPYANDVQIEDTEQYAFIGISGNYSDPLDKKGVFGFRMGMQNSIWRTIFTYENNFDEYQAFLIEADRTVIAGLFGGKGRVYIGASGGWIRYGADIITTSSDTNNSLVVEANDDTYNGNNSDPFQTSDGYAYGVNLGFMYYLSDQVDISLEYRYLFVDKINLFDHIQGPSISLQYFF